MKELAHAIVEAGKSKICSEAGTLETQEVLMVQLKSEGHLGAELLLSQGCVSRSVVSDSL